jgi:hypothetical protein
MSSRNNKRIFIGDFIETTKDFCPVIKGQKLAPLPGYKGIILMKWKDNLYGVRFGKYKWTNHLNGILSDSHGYFLKKEEFNLIKT